MKYLIIGLIVLFAFFGLKKEFEKTSLQVPEASSLGSIPNLTDTAPGKALVKLGLDVELVPWVMWGVVAVVAFLLVNWALGRAERLKAAGTGDKKTTGTTPKKGVDGGAIIVVALFALTLVVITHKVVDAVWGDKDSSGTVYLSLPEDFRHGARSAPVEMPVNGQIQLSAPRPPRGTTPLSICLRVIRPQAVGVGPGQIRPNKVNSREETHRRVDFYEFTLEARERLAVGFDLKRVLVVAWWHDTRVARTCDEVKL